jgi:hypothetical protein
MRSNPEGMTGEGLGMGDRLRTILLLILLAGHMVWVLSHFVPVYVGPDAGGLFVQARLLATELSTGFRPESPLQFLGNHWLETPDGDFHSRFPPGLPTALAVFWLPGGALAPFILTPLLATGVVGLTYLVGRRWIGAPFALWAALLVATLPPLNLLALHGDAHVAVTALLLMGIFLLFRWEDGPTWGRATVAGLALGLIPAVRYPEAVVGVGVVAFFLSQRGEKASPRGLLPAGVAAAIPILLLAFHNAASYGAPWQTGYGLTNEQTAFAWSHLSDNLMPYLRALTLGGAGPFFLLGVAGVAWMCVRKGSRPRGLLLLGALAPLTLLYSAYYWGTLEEPSLTLRYFLPTLPLYFIASFWLARQVPFRRVAVGGMLLLSLLQLGRSVPEGTRFLLREWLGLARGRAVVVAVQERVPPGSVIIARREVQEILDYFGDWKLVDDRMVPGTPARGEVLLGWELPDDVRSRLATLPSPTQIGKAVEERARYAGLADRDLAGVVIDDLWNWAGNEGEVFWLGSPHTVAAFQELAGGGLRAQPLGEVALPGEHGGGGLPYWVPSGPLVLFHLDLTPDEAGASIPDAESGSR